MGDLANRSIIGLVALLASAAATAAAPAPERTLLAEPPRAIADFQLTDQAGRTIKLADLRGAPVLPIQGAVVGDLLDDPAHPLAEGPPQLLGRRVGILERIVQDRGGQHLRIGHAAEHGQRLRNLDAVVQIGRPILPLPALIAVLLGGEAQRGEDQGKGR